MATGAVYYFTLRGSQIYWLGFADSFLSIHRSSLDGSGEHTVIDKLPADDYVFEIAATDAHVYYLGGLALHEVTEPGAVVDLTDPLVS